MNGCTARVGMPRVDWYSTPATSVDIQTARKVLLKRRALEELGVEVDAHVGHLHLGERREQRRHLGHRLGEEALEQTEVEGGGHPGLSSVRPAPPSIRSTRTMASSTGHDRRNRPSSGSSWKEMNSDGEVMPAA